MTSGVYLIQADNGLFKIGHSKDVESRLMLLRTASPVDLTLVHIVETERRESLEAEFHRRFIAQRRRGEWFELSEDDIIALKSYAVPCTEPDPQIAMQARRMAVLQQRINEQEATIAALQQSSLPPTDPEEPCTTRYAI